MNENLLDNCETKQDFLIKALDLAYEGDVAEAQFILRQAFDHSEIQNEDMLPILKGEYKICWRHNDCISIVPTPNYFQYSRINTLKEEFKNLVSFKDSFYSIVEKADLEFFKSVVPIKIEEEKVYKSEALKQYLFSIKAPFFMIKGNNVIYLNKISKEINPLIIE